MTSPLAEPRVRDHVARPSFRADIEGLRGVAIALVVVYHYQLGPFPGGNCGVDVFFVISGFVITAMLLRERDRGGSTSLGEFYARRIRRILPAATATLVATLVATVLLIPRSAVASIAVDARSASLFFSNVRLKTSAGALHIATHVRTPVAQFWSLSIEEQFYFVWPMMLLACCTVASVARRRLVLGLVLLAVFVSSAVTSIVWTQTDRNAAYFSSFTRAGELALGALVAVCLPVLARMPSLLGTVLSWIGLLAVVASGIFIADQHAYPGALVLWPISAAAVAIAGGTVASRRGAVAVLATRPMVALGAISYSLYLWHFPLITIAYDRLGHPPPLEGRLALLAAALAISFACYVGLENPIRRSRYLASRRGATAALGLCLIGFSVAVSLVVGENFS